MLLTKGLIDSKEINLSFCWRRTELFASLKKVLLGFNWKRPSLSISRVILLETPITSSDPVRIGSNLFLQKFQFNFNLAKKRKKFKVYTF